MDRNRKFTVTETLQALTVDVIRRLWGRGLYRDNKWLQMTHENWFDIWVEWRTQITMRDVDTQAEDILEQWERDDELAQAPVFTETEEGETLLGGPMQMSHPDIGRFNDNSDKAVDGEPPS